MIKGRPKERMYEFAIISAAAFDAAYGLVGSSLRVSVLPTGSSSSELPSPYTSSVETWRKRRMLCAFAASKRTCVPITFVIVKTKELPKELSTCVSAAKCMTVSMLYCSITKFTISALQMSPFTKR